MLDLAKNEIRSAWFDDAMKAMGEQGTSLFEASDSRTCEETDGPVHGLAYVVPSTIEAQKVALLVDTGAQHSDIFASSNAGAEAHAAERDEQRGDVHRVRQGSTRGRSRARTS